jgi:DNA-binding CsgD family transcriptional regulator
MAFMSEVLDMVCALARADTVGSFIDRGMEELSSAVGGSLVSFNRMDLNTGRASVALRPYRAEQETAAHELVRLLDEHPLYGWYRTQPDWSPVRISDVVPWREFRKSRLLSEVLRPVGACHGIAVMLVPPVGGQWVYFMVNRADPDFTDDELQLCVRLQPALVALYSRLTRAGESEDSARLALTRREQAVLGYLADGLTAEAIARRLPASPATVRKHLQNLYAKLGVSDRLGAVLRGLDRGFLKTEDLSREFDWNMRFEWQRDAQ